MSGRPKNSVSKIEAETGLGSQPIIVVINFCSDCEEGWAKSEAAAIAEYNENNVDVDLKFLS